MNGFFIVNGAEAGNANQVQVVAQELFPQIVFSVAVLPEHICRPNNVCRGFAVEAIDRIEFLYIIAEVVVQEFSSDGMFFDRRKIKENDVADGVEFPLYLVHLARRYNVQT